MVAHRFSGSTACGIFPDRGWNRHLLLYQEDSSPLSRQGSPGLPCLKNKNQTETSAPAASHFSAHLSKQGSLHTLHVPSSYSLEAAFLQEAGASQAKTGAPGEMQRRWLSCISAVSQEVMGRSFYQEGSKLRYVTYAILSVC